MLYRILICRLSEAWKDRDGVDCGVDIINCTYGAGATPGCTPSAQPPINYPTTVAIMHSIGYQTHDMENPTLRSLVLTLSDAAV